MPTALTAVFLFTAAFIIVMSHDSVAEADESYAVYDADGLAALAAEVNGGDKKQGIRYTLEDDIDLSGYGAWTPIGYSSAYSFEGIFDGKGHTIKGLYINNGSLSSPAGLFGYVNAGGKVENVILEDVRITGNSHVGGLVGQLNSGSIVNCHVSGEVYGTGRVGGVVGSVNISTVGVTGCSFIGTVAGKGSGSAFDNIGGIAGYIATSRISQCYAEGTVQGRDSVGGIVGHISSSTVVSVVTDCYFIGDVSGRNYVGGIAGDLNRTNTNTNTTVTKCYAVGTVSGTNSVGGIAGYLYHGRVTDCVALNETVTATSGGAGRVVGTLFEPLTAGQLSNNAAFSRMTAGGTDFPAGQSTGSGNNGADMNSAKINADGTLGGIFTSSPWIVEDGRLPSFAVYDMPGYLLPIVITEDMFDAVENAVYDGSAHFPDVIPSGTEPWLTFTISEYLNNINAGTASVILIGTGDCAGTVTLYFTILPKALTDELQVADVVYNGSAHTHATVSDALAEGIDYEIAYQNNVNAGVAAVTVTGIGNYTGTLTEEFTILPLPITVTPVAGQSKEKGSDEPVLLYTMDGGFDGMVLDGALSRAPGEDAGEYPITLGTLGGPNYDITFVDGVMFEISAAPIVPPSSGWVSALACIAAFSIFLMIMAAGTLTRRSSVRRGFVYVRKRAN
jgi:hypothetical protein